MDTPSREIFWSIHYGWVVYLLAGAATLILIVAVLRRLRLWLAGRKDDTFTDIRRNTREFVRIAIVDGLAHKRILSDPYPGIMHALLFWGALLLLLASVADGISHYLIEFLRGNTYLAFSFLADLGGVMMLVGVGMAVYRRYVKKPDRLDSIASDSITLGLIFVVLVTGFLLEGARMIAAEAPAAWARWSFLGYGFSRAFAGSSMIGWYQGLWWFHAVLVAVTIGYVALAFPRLIHIFVAPLAVLLRAGGKRGALETIELQEVERPGFATISDFHFRDLVALDACMECGRCQEACPACSAEKPLNPRKVIQDIRARMVKEDMLLARDGMSTVGQDLVALHVGEEEIWECTTCGACRNICPVYVEHVDMLVGLRRSLVEHGQVFGSLARSLEGMCLLGNPWSEPQSQRSDWMYNLDVKLPEEAKASSLLYWVGCSGCYDPKGEEIARSMVNILNTADIDYFVLGFDEVCCGDPARRAGDEGLFQHLARKNIDTLHKYGVICVLTHCPHCYNTFRNEYPDLGGSFRVVHHTEFILQLILDGRLEVRDLKQRVAFHDPCYLGRWNGIVDQPREILNKISGLSLIEPPHNRERTFCCGGGGGQMWIEGAPGKRVNRVRFEEFSSTGIQIIVTACPFCKIMLDDASSTAGAGGSEIRVRDIAEII